MHVEVTYNDYVTIIGGSLSEDDFIKLRLTALAVVNDLIGYNEVTSETVQAYKEAVCLAVSKLAEFGTDTVVSGFTIGSFSVNSNGDTIGTGTDIARNAAALRLQTTGLLFSGVS